MIRIPVLDVNDSLSEVQLEDETYFLRMSWNSEGELWVLSLEDYTHNVIVAGMVVVADSPLLAMFRHLGVPRGEIYAVLMDDTRQVLRREDFATGDAVLVYVEEDEDVTV